MSTNPTGVRKFAPNRSPTTRRSPLDHKERHPHSQPDRSHSGVRHLLRQPPSASARLHPSIRRIPLAGTDPRGRPHSLPRRSTSAARRGSRRRLACAPSHWVACGACTGHPKSGPPAAGRQAVISSQCMHLRHTEGFFMGASCPKGGSPLHRTLQTAHSPLYLVRSRRT